jgi:hypothetical protein
MFNKKKKQPEQDRLGRQRQPRTEQQQRNAAVFSYHASRAMRPGATGRVDPQAPPSAASLRGKKLSLFRRVPVIIGICIVGVLAVLNMYVDTAPRIVVDTPSAVSESAAVPLRGQAAYQQAANTLLARSLLNKSKLTIHTSKIANDLQAQFPELTRVDISVPFIGTHPTLHLTPAAPRLLLNAGSVLYILDDAGRALLPANQMPNIEKLDLPVILDESGLVVTLGRPALSSGNVAFITEVIGQLKAKGLSTTSIVLPAGTSEMDIRLSGVGYFVKFSLQGDGRVQAGAYLAVKEQLARENKVPGSYVDVRVEDRAYYK